jgi:hypothetical protein
MRPWQSGSSGIFQCSIRYTQLGHGISTATDRVEVLLTAIEEQPLSRSLVTALRTAEEIGGKAFAEWVRLELMGYVSGNPAMTEDIVVPEYRAVSGLWYDDYGRPLVVDDPQLHFVNEIRLRYGAAELEGAASATDVLSMRETNFAQIIQQHLGATVTIFRFQPASVRQVLTNIKLHLTDQVTGVGIRSAASLLSMASPNLQSRTFSRSSRTSTASALTSARCGERCSDRIGERGLSFRLARGTPGADGIDRTRPTSHMRRCGRF